MTCKASPYQQIVCMMGEAFIVFLNLSKNS